MNNPKQSKVQVYAVIRCDLFLTDVTTDMRNIVTVKEILPTQDEAEREVERLNQTRPDERTLYFCQATRFYPNGRSG